MLTVAVELHGLEGSEKRLHHQWARGNHLGFLSHAGICEAQAGNYQSLGACRPVRDRRGFRISALGLGKVSTPKFSRRIQIRRWCWFLLGNMGLVGRRTRSDQEISSCLRRTKARSDKSCRLRTTSPQRILGLSALAPERERNGSIRLHH